MRENQADLSKFERDHYNNKQQKHRTKIVKLLEVSNLYETTITRKQKRLQQQHQQQQQQFSEIAYAKQLFMCS